MNIKNKVTGELASITTYDPDTGAITGLVPIGNTTLGSNANVIITGGNVGEVLTTDGAGNLSWSAGGGGGSYSNVDANAFMAAGLVGDIIPAGNNAANLGSSAAQFKDLFLSNATIYFNNIPLSVGTSNGVANTLLFNSLPVVTSDGNSNITTSGNVVAGNIIADGNITANTGYYFLGDGGLMSNLTINAGSQISDGTCNVDVNGTTANIITMGANGVANIATFDESNATFIGGVVASQYFYPNGVPITINYANSNVFSYLPTYDGDLPLVGNIIADGNITANTGYFFIGDGSLLTGTYANTNVANYLPGYTGNLDSVNNISATGNLVAGNLDVTPGGSIAFGSGGNVYSIPAGGLTGTVTVNGVNDRGISLTAGGTTPGSSYSQIQWVQDINSYDPYDPAGSITNWVYTQFDGTYIENFDLLNAPGYNYSWKFGIDGVLTAAGDITTPGNVTANYFIGDGSQLTGLPANYGNSDVANYLPTYTGNLGNVGNIVASGNVSVANLTVSDKSVLGDVGNVTITGGTTGQTLTTNGSGVLSWSTPAATYGNTNVANYLPTYTGNIGAGNVNVVTKVTTNSVSLGTGNLQLSGNLISTTGDTITIDPLGDGSAAGNVIVQGNMQVVGSLTYNNVVNATTNDLQWIAANNAINQAAASGGGLSVGPAGAYASLTYNAPANAWQSSLPIIATDGVNANGALSGATTGSFSGNVTASYFIGDGGLLSNLSIPAGTQIVSGTTSVAIDSAGGNIDFRVAGNLFGTISRTQVAIGDLAGVTGSANTVALGASAGYFAEANTITIGAGAGFGHPLLSSLGANSIAIGVNASRGGPFVALPGNTIVLNATGANLNPAQANSFFVAPVRNDTGNTTNIVYYNTTTKEVTYGPASSGGSSIANGTSNISIAAANGNINIAVNGIKTGTISANSIALGYEAGNTGQGIDAVAIGPFAGTTNQGANAVAIGDGAGRTNQQTNAISIGLGSAASSQGANAIAIGAHSGGTNQAANSISIGANAQTAAAAIVLNASGANLLGGSAGFYVNPVRNDTTAANTGQAVTYNTTSKELTYTNTLNLTGTVQAVDFIAGDASNASSTKTRIAYFGANSYIQTGNGTSGSTGNIVFSPYADSTAKVVINTATGNITANNIGNVAAVNLNGNASTYLNGAGAWSASTGSGGLRNITKISKGYGYGATLMIADGRLYIMKGNGNNDAWFAALYNQNTSSFAGVNNCYEITFPDETVGTIVDADSYGYSAYALFANGNLYTWGYNGYGQLGLGNTTNSFFPTLSNTNVAQVYTHTSQQSGPDVGIQRLVIRKTNNTFFGCGHDGQGQLGLGTTTSKTSWTAMPWIPTDVLSVWNLGGDLGNIFIQLANGTIQATGWNQRGQLGVGNYTATYTTPVNTNGWLGGDATMRIQSFGWGGPYNGGGGQENYCNITMFLDNGTTSRIASAGDNNWGSLGTNNFTGTNVPVTPVTSTGLTGRVTKMLFAGSAPKAVYALTSTGDLYGWGYNNNGQIATGNATAQGAPYLIAADVLDILGDVQGWDVNGYVTSSPFIKKLAGWYASGYNQYGQLGNGIQFNSQLTLSRVILPKGIDFKFIGCYSNDNAGLTRYGVGTDNSIWAWGYNVYGAIDPTATNYNIGVPTRFTPNALRT
jgi:alpha-tubulin suppressor-like RCC1 family protein